MLGSFGYQHGLLLTKNPKILRYYNVFFDIMVPKERIELSRHYWRGILSPLRLPFRHLGTLDRPVLSPLLQADLQLILVSRFRNHLT